MRKAFGSAAACALSVACLFLGTAGGGDKKPVREEGEFRIHASGKEIGNEKYVLISSEDSASSSSIVSFRNPGDGHQKIQLDTKLEMNARYVPRSYQLKSDVEGQKGTINGIFSPQQAMFEYIGGKNPRKGGLLVGEQYTVLDTNVFHHFIFLARLFRYGSKEKDQRFEVVIPQEQDSGVLRITELGKETLAVRGKKIGARHLRVDSGAVEIHLWVDEQKILQRITVPDRQIEVVRN